MTRPDSPGDQVTFLGLRQHVADDADVLILPLPFEGTVSYGAGTAAGPAAVLGASQQVELWDDEVDVDLETIRFHTAAPVIPQTSEAPGDYLARVQAAAQCSDDTLVIGIGGDHSLTPPLVRAAHGSDDLSDLAIVQIDAHTDLRDEYDGTIHSHACAMRRLTDAGANLLAIGIRASCREELEYAATCDQVSIYKAQALANEPDKWPELLERLRSLNGDVYLTVDADGLCPSLCPGTGTPEPGGLQWWPTLQLLSALLHDNGNVNLVGCDFVETSPMPNSQVNEFTTARLIAKLLANWVARR